MILIRAVKKTALTARINGLDMDFITASMVIRIYDLLPEATKQKMRSLPVDVMVKFASDMLAQQAADQKKEGLPPPT